MVRIISLINIFPELGKADFMYTVSDMFLSIKQLLKIRNELSLIYCATDNAKIFLREKCHYP